MATARFFMPLQLYYCDSVFSLNRYISPKQTAILRRLVLVEILVKDIFCFSETYLANFRLVFVGIVFIGLFSC